MCPALPLVDYSQPPLPFLCSRASVGIVLYRSPHSPCPLHWDHQLNLCQPSYPVIFSSPDRSTLSSPRQTLDDLYHHLSCALDPFFARMSTTSLQQFATSFSPFSNSQSARMTQSQTVGLDTLAEGSQYVLEQLQLSREGGNVDNNASDSLRHSLSRPKDQLFGDDSAYKPSSVRDSLAEARSMIRKSSSSGPVRRRISRACDQCNQLRTKCDGQNPCAHCIGTSALFYFYFFFSFFQAKTDTSC